MIIECLSILNFNININDRIKLFQTLILPLNKDEIEKQYKNLTKNKNLLSPLLNEIIYLSDYVYNYQQRKVLF